jgi:nucleoredoxin
MAFADLLGPKLVTKDGEKPTEEVLAGKTAVGIYFSAHWCPPCRGFTPKLAEMYKDAFQGKGMEIVFVSSDRDEAAYKDYYGEMPWVSVPFDSKDVKSSLDKKFKVQGIPTLVILGPDGSVITKGGRAAVMKDPKGEKYPWIPPTAAEKAQRVKDLLGEELLGKTSGKHFGIYFSAHWCPPCRGFTPKLADFYNSGLKEKLEIIFASSDKDQGAFDEYFKEMPWLALPFDKRDAKAELSDMCGVEGIPSFVIFNPDGTILTTDGRSKVMADPTGANLPDGWLPQPFNDINEDPSDINEQECLVSVGANESLHNAVKEVSSEYYAAAKKDVSEMPIRFFKAPDGGEITEKLRSLMKVSGDKLLFTDLSSGGFYYVCEQDVSDAAGVKAFISEVKAGKVEKKKLGQ